MKPHQIEVIENDEDYEYEYEYDEFEEDTIDVEDLPEEKIITINLNLINATISVQLESNIMYETFFFMNVIKLKEAL